MTLHSLIFAASGHSEARGALGYHALQPVRDSILRASSVEDFLTRRPERWSDVTGSQLAEQIPAPQCDRLRLSRLLTPIMVGRQMRLPGLDMVFRLAAPAVDILVKYTGVADLQVGDDEACVGPFRAGLHTGDDPLDAAPAGGPVEELLEAARLAFPRRGLEARLRAGLETLCRRNVVVGATPRI
jgi:hypothetical protein